jgi:hypothetical protein
MIGNDVSSIKGDKEDFVEQWNARLQRGIKRRREEEDRWTHNESFEDLKQWHDANGSLVSGQGDQITINKLGSYIRNYRAQVAYNNPRAKLTPKTSDAWEPIQVPIAGPGGQPALDPNGQVMTREVVPTKAREALLNNIVGASEQNIQQTSGLLTKAGILAWGPLKVGYRPVFESDHKIDGEQKIPIRDGRLDLSGFEKNRIDGSLIEDDDGRLIERTQIPIWEDFFIKFVNYRNIIIDPDGGNYWDDHSWVCEEEIRDLSEVKADKLFKNTKDLKASGYRADDNVNENFSASASEWSKTEDKGRSDGEDPVVRLFHIYDIMNRRYYVLADGHGEALRDVSWNEIGIVDHPYVDFRPSEIIGEFYQRPIASDLAPINELYNIARSYELQAMGRSTRKTFTRKGALDTIELEKFTNDEDMAVIEVDIPRSQPLNDVLLPFTPPPVSDAIYGNVVRIGNDFAEIGGQTDEARGKASADTATQVQAMEGYSAGRVEHDRKILAETWRRAFKKLNDAIDRHMTKERAIQVQGTDGQTFQALVDPDMIAGDFDVEVDFEELGKPNTAMQSAERARIAQIAGQAPHLFMSEPLVRGWLEPSGITDQNFINALVEASQMQMQMMQMQAMGANSPQPNAGPPTSEAEAIAQSGAGQQVPRQSGGA